MAGESVQGMEAQATPALEKLSGEMLLKITGAPGELPRGLSGHFCLRQAWCKRTADSGQR